LPAAARELHPWMDMAGNNIIIGTDIVLRVMGKYKRSFVNGKRIYLHPGLFVNGCRENIMVAPNQFYFQCGILFCPVMEPVEFDINIAMEEVTEKAYSRRIPFIQQM